MTPLRVVSLLDATGMTGPAKNLIQFCRRANTPEEGTPATEVSIATFCRAPAGPEGLMNPFIAAARTAGIEVDTLVERFRYDIRTIAQLKDLIHRRKPAIIETHGVRLHFLARMSGLSCQIPWVAFHHGYTAEDLKMLAYNQLDRWSLRAAACVFTDCRPFADQLAGMGVRRERLRVLGSSIEIQPGASEREIGALRDQLGIESTQPVILSVGRLSREKAHADLIAAARHLSQTRPDLRFRLVLVGDGPERDRLQQAVTAAGLSRVVHFAGQQSNVRPWYGMAQLFVLPSLSEGSPNVLLEAMAAGVPIVSTDVGGVPEMLRHEWSALLAPAGKPGEIAAQIGRLLANPELAARLASNASVAVRERYSPDSYRRAVVQTYAELASAESGSRK